MALAQVFNTAKEQQLFDVTIQEKNNK